MERTPLTEKQATVYKLIVQSLAEGVPPTVRELCREAKIKSTSTVHAILSALEDAGYITRNAGNSRGIRLSGSTPSVQVPVLGKVTAGNPILAVEQIEDYIPYPTRDAEGLFALRVSGLSMRDAGILDGDLIVADKNITARSGDIVVAMIEDEATVKRLGFEGGVPVLYPENPDFEPIYAERIDILGRVVGSFRQY
ncbi:MAG: transcriptional repressor LexA [Clostridia bacterium]|nr:transcriptional repressor LexA [Clostridia bacterium]MBQ4131466.1 transcriptional repressor LexA [Clostridia bacterium]MBQ7108345.1 transcriptional repressor LexA [Clostridia bacterium]